MCGIRRIAENLCVLAFENNGYIRISEIMENTKRFVLRRRRRPVSLEKKGAV